MRTLMTALWLTVACAAGAGAGTPIDESRSADPDAAVSIDNLSGSVTVTGGDVKEVHITGTLGKGAENLEISGTRHRVEIEVVLPDHARNVEATDLEITLPRGCSVSIEGVNLRITVSQVTGKVELQTVNGEIEVVNVDAVEAESVNGPLVIRSSGPCDVETTSGDIRLEDVRGRVSAETVSGDIRLGGGPFTEIDASSVSGKIGFAGTLEDRAECDFETHSGDITLELDAEVSADFDVETFSGDIENELGPGPKRADPYEPGLDLSFHTGQGDAQVGITTFSGDIKILRRR